MCQDVIGYQKVGYEAVRSQPAGNLAVEEYLQNIEAQAACSGGRARSRFDSRALHTGRLETVEECPVVGGHLNYPARLVQAEPGYRLGGESPTVLFPCGRVSAEVGVVGVE